MATGGSFGLPGFDPTYAPAGPPSHGTGAPPFMGLPSGGGSPRTSGSPVASDEGDGRDWGGLIEAGVPLLFSLFGPKNKEEEAAKGSAADLQGFATSLFGQGQGMTAQGQGAMAPVLKYLMAVAGGDPTALFEATQPERARVLDQYDTAKKAMEFAPRGGGRASSTLDLEARKASDLSSMTAEARRSGVRDLATVGGGLIAEGGRAQSSAANAMEHALAGFQGLSAQTAQKHAALGSSIGKTIATALPLVLSFFSHSAFKEAATPIDSKDVLAKLRTLQLRRWKYKGDDVEHIGPFAEDFAEVFGVGDGVTIHVADVMGVLLAAQQAMAAQATPTHKDPLRA
jgi:hypothetical protein